MKWPALVLCGWRKQRTTHFQRFFVFVHRKNAHANSRIVNAYFSFQTTWSNREMVAETRCYIREFKIYEAKAATTPQILHTLWTKTKALHTFYVFSLFPFISYPFSANLRREMTISQVLQRTWTHRCEFESRAWQFLATFALPSRPRF